LKDKEFNAMGEGSRVTWSGQFAANATGIQTLD
jgi:hypothetical protein